MVVTVMIIRAAALAFVVLYNLTNINIAERVREIATFKVLGFYNRETSSFIYKENIILTILGIFVGLFLGNLGRALSFRRRLTMLCSEEIFILSPLRIF